MNQPAKLSKTGITGWRRVTASDLRTSTENSRRSAQGKLSLLEAKSRTRSGRHDVAGVRDRAGGSDYRPAPPGSSWSVSGAALAKSVHRERRWTETSVGGRGTGGPVSYTHLRAHETDSYLVCRLLLEKKKKK